jgi:1-acyl-sn-glycerol-3-phosphate acyltransferase
MKTFAVLVTKLVFRVFYKVEVINEGFVPKEGPALLCATHNTFMDMFFLGYKLDRWVYWMAKEELFKNPILGYIIKKLGAFPVKRGKGDIGSIKTAYKLLKDGKIVGIFPQGTRVKAGNVKQTRVKPGAAMLAVNSGAVIIPAVVQGSYKIFSKILVKFGEPFKLEIEEGVKPTTEELTRLSEDIMSKVNSLMEV